MDAAWSPDYCLACDKQTTGGAYCSQVCRLADLETSSCTSSESIPSATVGYSPSTPSTSTWNSGLQLQPAFNFSAYRSPFTSSTLTSSTSSQSRSTGQTSYLANSFPGNMNSSRLPSPPRALAPSTSRSSLSSISSNTSQTGCMSDRTRTELRSYSNSFDLIRNWRRRMASN